MSFKIPDETILAFARTIFQESRRYGFGQVDMIRLINALMDVSTDVTAKSDADKESKPRIGHGSPMSVSTFPLKSERLMIRQADPASDIELLEKWMQDNYGKHFLLSCATAQSMHITALLENPHNEIGIVMRTDGTPIGAVAFLDVDMKQRRAELRKVIGEPSARGKGIAEEATMLWIKYGCEVVGLEKFYVSTLQTHLRNIQLNESIGFSVEGILQDDVRIGEQRLDVLRMGLTAEDFRRLTNAD